MSQALAARERDAALGASGSAYSQAVAEATQKRDKVTEPNPSESATTVTVDYGKQHDLR